MMTITMIGVTFPLVLITNEIQPGIPFSTHGDFADRDMAPLCLTGGIHEAKTLSPFRACTSLMVSLSDNMFGVFFLQPLSFEWTCRIVVQCSVG